MKTMKPHEAIREIMTEKGITGAAIYRAMEAIEPGIGRQKAYDRIKSVNPKIATINSVLAPLGYSVAIVPNEKIGKLADDCYRLVTGD